MAPASERRRLTRSLTLLPPKVSCRAPPFSFLCVQYPCRLLVPRLTKCASLPLLFAPGSGPRAAPPRRRIGLRAFRQRADTIPEECSAEEVPMETVD